MDSDAGVTVVALLEAIDTASIADLLDCVDAASDVAWLGSNEGAASVVCDLEDTSSVLDRFATELGVSESVEAVVKLFRSVDFEINKDVDSVELIDSVVVGVDSIELLDLRGSVVEGAETTEVVKGVGGVGSVSVSIDELTSVDDKSDEIDGVASSDSDEVGAIDADKSFEVAFEVALTRSACMALDKNA